MYNTRKMRKRATEVSEAAQRAMAAGEHLTASDLFGESARLHLEIARILMARAERGLKLTAVLAFLTVIILVLHALGILS